MIQPWDKHALQEVGKSVLKSDLGLTPNSDGSIIRINIPTLTEERRRQLVRLVGEKVEEAHVAVRNIRRDSLERLRRMEKGKTISEDESRRSQQQLQQVTDAYINKMNTLRQDKEAEVMEL